MEIWCGLRPLTPDTRPVIGRSPKQENLILATGHGMLGISMVPITGKLVSQLIAGDELDFDLKPLSVERFS